MNRRFLTASVVPPYILENIKKNGSGADQAAADNTLEMDDQMRASRVQQLAIAAEEALAAPIVPESRAYHRQRAIYTNEPAGPDGLPGLNARTEGQPPTGDEAADSVYDGLGLVYDFYREVFERDSIDDRGRLLRATVHFKYHPDVAYSNAFWNGSQMVFGDGDDVYFRRHSFAHALDLIGHELTHGVTQYTARLQYSNKAGALNESVSDVMGSLIKQWTRKQTVDQADWLIGENLFTDQVGGVALRSLKAPGTAFDDPVLEKDLQPAHMDGFVQTEEDNGGVHLNSGIPNRAFYLAATAIGGYAWEKAGQIWYDTITGTSMYRHIGFIRFGQATVRAAAARYGENSLERAAVEDTWKSVGVAV